MYSKTNLVANKHVFVNAELDQHKKTIISYSGIDVFFPTSIIYPNLDFSHHSYFKIHFLISEISDFIKNKKNSYLGGSRVELRATEQGCKH